MILGNLSCEELEVRTVLLQDKIIEEITAFIHKFPNEVSFYSINMFK